MVGKVNVGEEVMVDLGVMLGVGDLVEEGVWVGVCVMVEVCVGIGVSVFVEIAVWVRVGVRVLVKVVGGISVGRRMMSVFEGRHAEISMTRMMIQQVRSRQRGMGPLFRPSYGEPSEKLTWWADGLAGDMEKTDYLPFGFVPTFNGFRSRQ